MPVPLVLEKKYGKEFHLALWKVSEGIEQLVDDIAPSNSRMEKFKKVKLPNRKLEWIGRSYLYDYLNIDGLSYLENGKPVLENEYISISHCGDLVVMVRASFPVGIDLQNPVPILNRIKLKFCNEKELRWIDAQEDALYALTQIWSAKEAVFKIYGENVPFADGMRIRKGGDSDSLVCDLKTDELEGQYQLQIDHYMDYILVYNIQ